MIPVAVVGLVGEVFGPGARDALAAATVVVGSERQLAHVAAALDGGAERVTLQGPLEPLLEAIDRRSATGEQVCVLASGDPGFFGIAGVLSERLGPGRLRVHPAPSSVSLAFGRLGVPWDDATVVSAHGRPLADAVARITGPKVAVLTSPATPPEAVGRALLDRGSRGLDVAVVSALGEEGELVTTTDLEGLAAGPFSPMSVVLLLDPGRPPHHAPLRWGRGEAAFEHRRGMITKAEVRAVVLSKLVLPPTGVLWDVGAGSGSVGIECAALCPGLRVTAVERRPDDAERIAANAQAHGVEIEIIAGDAPDALAGLPDPDRAFVGGGGIEVLGAVLQRLRPGGVVVATYAVVDRAAAAAQRLGHLVQVSVARGVPAGELGLRLAAENPVFVCWGPGD